MFFLIFLIFFFLLGLNICFGCLESMGKKEKKIDVSEELRIVDALEAGECRFYFCFFFCFWIDGESGILGFCLFYFPAFSRQTKRSISVNFRGELLSFFEIFRSIGCYKNVASEVLIVIV